MDTKYDTLATAGWSIGALKIVSVCKYQNISILGCLDNKVINFESDGLFMIVLTVSKAVPILYP